MLNPSHSGKLFSLEAGRRLTIDELIKEANKTLKRAILQARLEAFGAKIDLTTTKTRFGGIKYWFVCPNCGRRCGVLYRYPLNTLLGCRLCLGLRYRNQQYKGMIENSVNKK
jgi:hypothetical protein